MSQAKANNNSSNTKQRKKKTADRLAKDFHLDNTAFGLNGQDFGLSQLQPKTKKKRSKPPPQLVATPPTLEAFSDDVATLWCHGGTIPVLDEPPSALAFLRDHVSPSRPCIIRNALLVRDARKNRADHHHTGNHLSLSLAKADMHPDQDDSNVRPLYLSLDDIVEMDPQLEIVVDATPDGQGDCVRTVQDPTTGENRKMFVTPEQRCMTLEEFRKQLRQGRREQRKKEAKDNDTSSSQGDSSSDEEEEEPQMDIHGKRIFPLKKNSQKQTPKNELQDFVYEAVCSPTNASNNKSAPSLPNINISCNPLDDMQELMCFMTVDDNDKDKKDNNGTEADEQEKEKPPPPPPPSVLYYSRQNNCFPTELPTIYEATRHVIPDSIPFAEDAFGTGKPEAMNLWIGDERVCSSMHKDPYENLFYVASGEKLFTLCPPSDAPFLYEQDFLSASFCSQPPSKTKARRQQQGKRQWTVKTGYESEDESDSEDDDDDIRLNHNNHSHNLSNTLDSNMEPVRPEKATAQQESQRPAYVRWIESDVAALTNPYYEKHQRREFPLLHYAHPIHHVRVQAGEMLYLPALWFHRVTQSRETVGLNYWYNMNFNSPHWCYFQFLNTLQWKTAPQLHRLEEDDGEKGDKAERESAF